MMIKKEFIRLPVLFAILFSAMIVGLSFAQSSGTSIPSLTPSSLTLHQGSSGSVAFKVTLISGSAGSTCLFIPNNNYLQSVHIVASIYPDAGTPPFNGTLTVSAGANTPPGTNYTVGLATGCADGLNGNKGATLSLTVLGAPITTTSPSSNATAPSTTTPTTAPASTTAPSYTTIPSTTPSSPNNTYVTVAVIAIIIIIIIMILAIWWTRK